MFTSSTHDANVEQQSSASPFGHEKAPKWVNHSGPGSVYSRSNGADRKRETQQGSIEPLRSHSTVAIVETIRA